MDSFPTYLYMTDIYDAAVFSIMATNNGSLLGNAAKDIRRAVVTGTMPAELSANNPESGCIVCLDAASLTVDAYGSVNPYVLDRDPDNPQPYGIYDSAFSLRSAPRTQAAALSPRRETTSSWFIMISVCPACSAEL